MKKCHICKQFKPFTEFNIKKNRKDGLQTHCRECNRQLSKNYYATNKEKHIKYAGQVKRNNIEKTHDWIIEYLKIHPCVDCGISNIVVLEFDHVRGIKFKGLSIMISGNYSLNKIKEEIKKCEVRCRNCHMIRTATIQGHYKQRDI